MLCFQNHFCNVFINLYGQLSSCMTECKMSDNLSSQSKKRPSMLLKRVLKKLDCGKTISNLSLIQLMNKTIRKCCKFNIYYRAVANIFTSRKRANTLVGMASIIINRGQGGRLGALNATQDHKKEVKDRWLNLLKFRTVL